MSQYVFDLKRPIIIPSPNIRRAFLIFPKDTCSLSYEILPKPKDSSMTVILTIVDKETSSVLLQLSQYNITETGFPSGIYENQAQRDQWQSQYDPLALQLAQKQQTYYGLQTEVITLTNTNQEVPQALLDEITVLEGEMATLESSITALGEIPSGQEIYINKYSEIIGYFDNKGAITAEGIAWAKTINFLGATLGDYLV